MTKYFEIVIAGAGGHALEVYDILERLNNNEVKFFDDINHNKSYIRDLQVIHELNTRKDSIRYYLGVGNPFSRQILFNKIITNGGKINYLRGLSIISKFSHCDCADIMDHCYIGPNVIISKGTLINTGSNIHHNAIIGEFCEISPGTIILGDVEIGSFTSIGANSTILPKVKIGENVTIGAGSVVTKNIPDNSTAYGVPAIIK